MINSENYDNSSLRESSSNMEDISDLKKKIRANANQIKEFEGHLRSLLNIANESELEYAIQVQKGLEKIKYLIEDNITSKHMLLKEIKKGEDLENEIQRISEEMEKNKTALEKDVKGKEILEKNQLLSNISMLSNEVDKYSEMNNNMINILRAKEKPANYAALLEEMHQLKQENKKLLNVINHVELNKVFTFDTEIKRNFFSCMSNPRDNQYSLNFN